MSVTHDEMNWIILAPGNLAEAVKPRPQHTYDLFNTTVKEALLYGERAHGINLLWGDPKASNNIRFQRQDGSSGPLKYGEMIAVNVRGPGGFLKFQRRDQGGISLVWAPAPVFEWKIMGGPAGAEVQTGKVIALFNMTIKDFLFYDPRNYGINLKWVTDKGKFNESWLEKGVNFATEHVDDAAEYVGD